MGTGKWRWGGLGVRCRLRLARACRERRTAVGWASGLGRRKGWLVPAILAAGCAALSHSFVSVGDASPETPAAIALVTVDTDRPVLLRAVDKQHFIGVQVSSKLRAFTYVLTPGEHVLWLSSAPYGLPFVPQRLKCFVLTVSLLAGSSYTLRSDDGNQAPILTNEAGGQPDVAGMLVDEPLVLERGCKWQ
mgnify:FL=1